MGVIEVGGDFRFANKPVTETLVRQQQGRHDLECYLALDRQLNSQEHGGHAAAAQFVFDLVTWYFHHSGAHCA